LLLNTFTVLYSVAVPEEKGKHSAVWCRNFTTDWHVQVGAKLSVVNCLLGYLTRLRVFSCACVSLLSFGQEGLGNTISCLELWGTGSTVCCEPVPARLHT